MKARGLPSGRVRQYEHAMVLLVYEGCSRVAMMLPVHMTLQPAIIRVKQYEHPMEFLVHEDSQSTFR
jgi:hypothetical protein